MILVRPNVKFLHNISAIVCTSQNGVIGNKNKIPWHLSDDLKNFREVTDHKCVLMGMNTFRSIGKPLPHRYNVVVSKRHFTQQKYQFQIVNSVEDGIRIIDSQGFKDLFIIGGASVYKQTFKYLDNIYLTRILKDFEGDTYFPYFNLIPNLFNLVSKSETKEENGIKYIFEKYERKYHHINI